MLSLCNLIILHDHNGTIYSLEGERERPRTEIRNIKWRRKRSKGKHLKFAIHQPVLIFPWHLEMGHFRLCGRHTFPIFMWCIYRMLESIFFQHTTKVLAAQAPYFLTFHQWELGTSTLPVDSPHLWSSCTPSTSGPRRIGLLPVISSPPSLQTGSWDARIIFPGISWLSAWILYPCSRSQN